MLSWLPWVLTCCVILCFCLWTFLTDPPVTFTCNTWDNFGRRSSRPFHFSTGFTPLAPRQAWDWTYELLTKQVSSELPFLLCLNFCMPQHAEKPMQSIKLDFEAQILKRSQWSGSKRLSDTPYRTNRGLTSPFLNCLSLGGNSFLQPDNIQPPIKLLTCLMLAGSSSVGPRNFYYPQLEILAWTLPERFVAHKGFCFL